MATAPLKSQPLHNFSLPQLRWGHKNHININHRYHRPSETTTTRERGGGGGGGGGGGEREPVLESENRFSFASCSSQKEQSSLLEREEEREKEKPWNLRPRKAVLSNGGEVMETAPFENVLKSTRVRGVVEGQQGVEKKEGKRKLWIALCREEIEEDVYAMTGSRPARRPKKRPKTLQKQLDNLFPGLYLAGISADSYHIDDAPR